jgi:hypothetical protein
MINSLLSRGTAFTLSLMEKIKKEVKITVNKYHSNLEGLSLSIKYYSLDALIDKLSKKGRGNSKK